MPQFTNEQRLAQFRFWLDSSYVFIPRSPKEQHYMIVSDILTLYPTPTEANLKAYLDNHLGTAARNRVKAAWFDFWESRADVGDHFPQMPD